MEDLKQSEEQSIKICYTGIGTSDKFYFSVSEFLDIMDKFIIQRHLNEDLKKNQHIFKNWNLPNDFKLFSLNDWLEYSGANLINQNLR